jgi:valyl-tRNA synthetase
MQQDLGKAHAKLDNTQFVANAPAAVIQKERDRAAELMSQIEALEQQISRL